MNLFVDQEKAVLHSGASPRLMMLLPQLEGRRSWVDGRTKLQFEATEYNISVISQLGNVNVIRRSVENRKIKESTYTPKTKPFKHQEEAIKKIRKISNFALFMEQGTGKTKVIIDRVGELFSSGVLTALLVVTRKGVHRQWIMEEFPKHYGSDFIGEYWQKKINPNLFNKDKLLKVFSINIDALRSKQGYESARHFCEAHSGSLFIAMDESQDIKNSRSQRYKSIISLRPYSKYRCIATGTPIAKDLTDEWAQLNWLDPDIIGIKYKTTFMREYCVMGGSGPLAGKIVVGAKNIDRFKKITEPYTFRVTKESLGLLPKQYSKWKVDLTPIQHQHIKELREELETQLASGVTINAQNAVSIIGKFQQITSGFIIDESGKEHNIISIDRNPKILAIEEWIDSFDEKALIWFHFKYEAHLLSELLSRKGISFVSYHGGVKDKERASAIDNWKKPKGARVLIANPASAGTGLNLQGICSSVGYMTNSFNSINRWQSEDRTHRIGTNGMITYTDFVARKSVDNYVLMNLRKKKDLSSLVLDDIKAFFDDGELR